MSGRSSSCSRSDGPDAVDLFAALANPLLRRILEMLVIAPSTVNALVSWFDLERQAISEHLPGAAQYPHGARRAPGSGADLRCRPGTAVEVAGWLQPFQRYWRERLKVLHQGLKEETYG